MSRFLPRAVRLSRPFLGGIALCALVLSAFALASHSQKQSSAKHRSVPVQTRVSEKVVVSPAQIRVIEPPIIIEPRSPIFWPPPSVGQSELQLVSQRAQIEIVGATAKTHLFQTFRNPTSSTVEGTYLFPLPNGAAISDFAMTVGGKRVAAEILDRDKARDIYESIVRKLRDPAILEFTDRNAVRARIFPIAAGAEQQIEIEYSNPLSSENGALRYSLPLRLPVGGTAQNASVEIRVRDAKSVRNVYSPTHAIESKADGNTLRISGEWKTDSSSDNASSSNAARDFVLYLTQSQSRVGLNLVTQVVPDEDGYFMLMAAPDPTLQAKEIAAKDAVFTLDTSGSMEGAKIEQARQALLSLLGNLNPTDRFNIITFSSDVNTFHDQLVDATPQNIQKAREFVKAIKAVGGTDIDEALRTSLKMFHADGTRPHQLIFMTDGQPTVGETDTDTILQNVRKIQPKVAMIAGQLTPGTKFPDDYWQNGNLARIFVFGVGYDVNTKLLDELAEENRGASDYVLPQEDIEAKVGSLYNKIAFPVLSNAQLDWGGANVYDVYPRQLPDLFKGSQVVVFGRFKTTSSTRIRLTGDANGQAQNVFADGDFKTVSTDNDLLPRLWAMRKIGFLLDDARRKGVAPDEEVKAEVIALSKKFGIVTPLTAALISEDEQAPVNFPRPMPFPRPFPMRRGGAIEDNASGVNAAPSVAQSFAATSGETAVGAARATAKMRRSDRLDTTASLSTQRFVAGKTFVLQGDVWTDTDYDAKKAPLSQTVKFASDEYFSLARDAKVAQWLSVGNRVLVVIGNRVVKVEP